MLTSDQRIEVEKEMIGLVKRFAIYGIAVTAEPKLFEEIMPNLPEIGSAYSFCAHACLVADSERTRSGFRADSDHHSELIPITVPR